MHMVDWVRKEFIGIY